MAEFESRKPYPIPQEEDYCAAAKLTDSLFQENGGAWAYYHRLTLIDVHSKATMRTYFEAMSSQARLIEPIEDDDFTPVDAMFRATHAFRAGMWTGSIIEKYIHNEQIGYEAINNTIAQSLPYPTFSGQEEYEFNGQFLKTIGDEGLKIVGFETRSQLDVWGEDIVSDENVRRYYALGAGAIFYTASEIYKSLFPTLEASYQSTQLINEVSQYLADVTDSGDS